MKFKYIPLVFLTSLCYVGQAQDAKISIPGGNEYGFEKIRLTFSTPSTLIGHKVANEASGGFDNTYIGSEVAYKNRFGTKNTMVGTQAGYNNENSGNVFIGFNAGMNAIRSNTLYIANSDTEKPLILGDFANRYLTVNDNLIVSNRLTVNENANVNGNLTVEGQFYGQSASLSSYHPFLQLYSTDFMSGYRVDYSGALDRFSIKKLSEDDASIEIEDGLVTLPYYSGSVSALGVDASGKIVKRSGNQLRFNRYEFTQDEFFGNYTLIRKGVQFEDGTVLSSFSALMKDNDTSGSVGVHNTAFAGLYRISRTEDTGVFQVIFRVDGSDTAANTFEEFFTTAVSTSGSNVIDNENYIYVIQCWYCNDCGVNEVSIVE